MPEPPQTLSALRRLQSLILLLPDNVPMAGPDDLLAVFSGNPESIHDDPSVATQDLWEEILNQKMHIFFGKTDTNLESLIQWGQYGIEGFVNFVTYFVEKRGVNPVLFDSQVQGFTKAIGMM